jgi:hypothetical protein
MNQDQADELEPHYRTATFGKLVEDFLNSDIGQYLIMRAELEQEQAMEQLIELDPSPTNVDKIRELRAIVLRTRSIKQYLAEAVAEGLHSLGIIEDLQ